MVSIYESSFVIKLELCSEQHISFCFRNNSNRYNARLVQQHFFSYWPLTQLC